MNRWTDHWLQSPAMVTFKNSWIASCSGSPPKFNRLLLVFIPPVENILSKFIGNFMSYNEDGQTDRQTQTSTNLDERNENILRPFFQVKPRPENQTRYSHCDALPSPVPLIRLLCSQGTNASFFICKYFVSASSMHPLRIYFRSISRLSTINLIIHHNP